MTSENLVDRLLRDHAASPHRLFYDVGVLGTAFGKAEVDLLDQTYADMVDAGLMEPSGSYASFFGDPKQLHRVTGAGVARATASSATVATATS